MRKVLLRIARHIGVPGACVLAILTVVLVVTHLSSGPVSWPIVVKFYACAIFVLFLMGGSRTEAFPYLLCTHCGRKNRDDGTEKPDLSKWTCGWCKEAALVRVGVGRKAA